MNSKLWVIVVVFWIGSFTDGTKTESANRGCVISGMLQLERELTEVKTRLTNVEKTTADLGRHRQVPKVSFQVNLVKDPVPVSNNEILIFDDVTLNAGNAYNPNSGIFDAPVTGMYFFWANILNKINRHFAIYLVKDGEKLIRGYTGYRLRHGTATISYMLKLKKGDHVWFANEQHGGAKTVIEGLQYSNYGGTLLYT